MVQSMPLPAVRELSRHQRLVLESLQRRGRMSGAYELMEDLRHQGFHAPTQIYRALDSLVQRGLVHRVESERSFIACDADHTHDSVLLWICQECKRVEEGLAEELVYSEALEKNADRFRPSRICIEVHGVCVRCAS